MKIITEDELTESIEERAFFVLLYFQVFWRGRFWRDLSRHTEAL